MFSNSIDSKANKIKLNVDSYLNERKKETNSQQPIPSVRRPDQMPPIPSLQPQNSATQSVISGQPPNSMLASQVKPVEIQVKQMALQNKIFDKQPLTLKNILKQKSINIFYMQEQIRYKLQVRAVDNQFQMKINQQKGSVDISFKKAVKYKFYKPESGEPKWMITTQIRDEKITILTVKDGKTLKTYFEGVVPEQCIKIDLSDVKPQEKIPMGQPTEKEDVIDSEDVVNFAMPSSQILADTEKFRKGIKDMKEQEKIMILMDIFKIKKQYDQNLAIDRRKLKCPIHSCQKTYREISQLKTHLKKHPQLNKHGIEFTQFGTFEYSSKALDLALYLGKLYPFELKKIIRKMKTKQVIE